MHLLLRTFITFISIAPVLIFSDGFAQVSDRTVIQINKVKISEYELEKNMDQFKQRYQQMYGNPAPPDSIRGWIKKFTDEAFLVAEAFEKGYHNSVALQNILHVSDRYILTQMHGPLYEKQIVNKITLTEEELKEAFEWQNNVIQFSYIKLSIDNDSSVFNNPPVLDSITFENFRKKASVMENAFTGDGVLAGPNPGYWNIQDAIRKLKKGQVSIIRTDADFYSKAIYIVRVIGITHHTNNNYTLEKDNLTSTLKACKEFVLLNARIKNILNESKPEILLGDKKTEIVKIFNGYEGAEDVNIKDFSLFLKEPVLTYQKSGKTINFTLQHFLERFQDLPLKNLVRSEEQFNYQLLDIVIADYLYEDAVQLGLTTDKKFLLDRQGFINKKVIENLTKKELLPRVQITKTEIDQLYQKNRLLFKDGVTAIASVFTFASESDAFSGRYLLSSINQDKLEAELATTRINGLKDTKLNAEIHYQDEHYSKKIRDVVFGMNDHEISWPMRLNGNYIVFIKMNEWGSRVKTVEEVEEILRNELELKKLNALKAALIAGLKTKYKLIEQITYSKYY